MSAPSEVLDYPWPSEPLPTSVDVLLGLSDWISPSFYLRKGIEIALGTDPAEWLAAEFGGDWQKVAQVATALEQLGEYMQALGRDVQQAAVDLAPSWEGNAADSAGAYFEKLAAAIQDLQAPLADIGHSFDSTAIGMKGFADAIVDLLGLLMDYLIELAIAACATGAFSWTGIGLAIGGAGTAYLAYKATSTWMKVVEVHGYASTAAKALVGLTAGPLGLLHVDHDLNLPAAYDHPGV